jgi:hypothetical protein
MVGDGGGLGLESYLSCVYPWTTKYHGRIDGNHHPQIRSRLRSIKSCPHPMSISKRLTIAWGGSAPYEDTDTLVLTGRTYFVDVRVKKGSDPPSLDWAIAGTRTSRPGANPGIDELFIPNITF